MKLWQKVSVISIAVLLLVVVVCGASLLIYAQNSILDLTTKQTKDQQRNLQTSFVEMVQYYLEDESNSTVKEAAVKYCFSRFADDTAVLTSGTETLYSAVAIRPEELLPITSNGGQQVYLDEIEGRNVLIVGGETSVLNDLYGVYIVKDVTEVYNNIAVVVWRFVLICVASMALGTALIIWLVRKASRPLFRLKDTTRRIAVGEYGERVDISSKDEIGELAADFNTMADAVQAYVAGLEDTAQRQRLFIGGLTHEFKTPMTSMMIHTDTLLTTKLSGEETNKSLLHIHEQCRWLERLTQKLLKLITLEEEIRTKPERVADLFEDVTTSALETLTARNTPLKTEYSTDTLEIDYDLMKSALINLIDNASKASEPGQEIWLKAYGNTVEVSDNGAGIPEDEIARITDAFYMVDRSRSKKKGGSGLGLALVKRIADAHKAELIIESEEGEGTVIRMIFRKNLLR